MSVKATRGLPRSIYWRAEPLALLAHCDSERTASETLGSRRKRRPRPITGVQQFVGDTYRVVAASGDQPLGTLAEPAHMATHRLERVRRRRAQSQGQPHGLG